MNNFSMSGPRADAAVNSYNMILICDINFLGGAERENV